MRTQLLTRDLCFSQFLRLSNLALVSFVFVFTSSPMDVAAAFQSRPSATPDPYFSSTLNKSTSKIGSDFSEDKSWDPPFSGKQNQVNTTAGALNPMPSQPLNQPQEKSKEQSNGFVAPSEYSMRTGSSIIRQPQSSGGFSVNKASTFQQSGVEFESGAIRIRSSEVIQNNEVVSRTGFEKPTRTGGNEFGPRAVGRSGPVAPASRQLLGLTENKSSLGAGPDGQRVRKELERRNVSKRQKFEPGTVLALVGGEPLFVGDMLFEINQLLDRFMPNASKEVKQREREKMIPQILPKFVESKLLFMGTLQQLPDGVDVEQILEQAAKEFDEKALAKILEASGVESPAMFDAQLRAQGSSLRKFRRSWSQDQMTKYFLSQQLKSESEVTHQELLDAYRENKATYAQPAKCKWEQVMIRFDKAGSHLSAKKQIVELGNQIVYGASLSAVAKKSSDGFQASNGGQHDWTTKGALVLKELDKAIFELPIGQLSDIIESRDGFHIVRVLERTEATHKPFLEAQVEIKADILEKKRRAAYDAHLEKLRREIPVEYVIEGVKLTTNK